MTVVVNRRERVRAATVQEIKDVARQQLVALGPNSVSLRAIAREMGMTAPALYRYFPSFDHLVRALVSDMYEEVCGAMETSRDFVSAGDPAQQLVSVVRTFRSWAVGHRAEFGLIFGSPLPGPGSTDDLRPSGAHRCEQIVLEIFAELWEQRPFPVAAPDNIPAALLEQLSTYRATMGSTLPVGALVVAMDVWMRVFGAVSVEVYGHLPFTSDGEAFFSQQLADILAGLGIAETA